MGMNIRDALPFVGRTVHVTYADRHGEVHTIEGYLNEVSHVPMYGASLQFDQCEVSLERVLAILDVSEKAA
jgi:hypothetical protein